MREKNWMVIEPGGSVGTHRLPLQQGQHSTRPEKKLSEVYDMERFPTLSQKYLESFKKKLSLSQLEHWQRFMPGYGPDKCVQMPDIYRCIRLS